jgi:hypothetical protein
LVDPVLTGPLDALLAGRAPIDRKAFRGTKVSADLGLVVLYHLAAHYNERTGECFPGIALLAEQTGHTKNRIYATLDVLERLGLLRRERRKSRRGPYSSPNYTFPWFASDDADVARRSGDESQDRDSKREERSARPQPSAGNGTVTTATDPTHGNRHPPGNPLDIDCRGCAAEQRRAETGPTPTPPTRAELEAETYCDDCGQRSDLRHLASCTSANVVPIRYAGESA